MQKEKVLVAMSGGVDSSVAAYLLKEEGHDVIGVSMVLVSCHRPTDKSCCSASDRLDAKRVCDRLGIPYAAVDYREDFQRKVIQPFVKAYAEGRTPIPCTSCNADLKFKAFFEDMERYGASSVATGHYARIEKDENGLLHLHRGDDPAKDQSYYLFQLTQKELKRLRFPLGGLRKEEVRRIAKEQGLVTYNKPDSQEICFVSDDDYAGFVERHGSIQLQGRGNFVDAAGNVFGRHEGIHAYTVGQRRGLGQAFGKRMYVIEIQPDTNEVVLGSDEDLFSDHMNVARITWTTVETSFEMPVDVRIRSTHTPAAARLVPLPLDESAVRVEFETPQRAIAPGQAAVFYRGSEVLGGGWIQ